MSKIVTTVVTGTLLMMAVACGSSDDAAVPSETTPSTGISASSSSTPITATPLPVPASTPTQVAGKRMTVGNMTFTVPVSWKLILSDANTALFSDQKGCRIPTQGCAPIVFGSPSKYNADDLARVSKTQLCVVPGKTALPAVGKFEQMGTRQVGGQEALYYEQALCPPYLVKPSRAYTWYVQSKNALVSANDVPSGSVDLSTLKSVLDNVHFAN